MLQGAAFRVLACFYDNDRRSFVELCKRAGYPTDLGGYYLRRLLNGAYVQKVGRGRYQILPKGKQQLAIYYGKQLLAPKPRLNVAIIAQCDDSFLVLNRKVQPFIGTAEWPAGAVRMGEATAWAAKRISKERTGLGEVLRFAGFFRRIDVCEGLLFDDKLFAIYACELPSADTVAHKTEVGETAVYTLVQLRTLPHRSKALLDILEFSQTPGEQFVERTYDLELADFSLPEAGEI